MMRRLANEADDDAEHSRELPTRHTVLYSQWKPNYIHGEVQRVI